MHTKNIHRYLTTSFVTAILGLAVGCGGDSGDSHKQNSNFNGYTGTALRLPAEIIFGEVKSSTPTTGTRTVQSVATASATDPGTDYVADPVDRFQIVEGNVALDIVNVFLCMLNNVSAYEKINSGPYKTLLSLEKCQNTRGVDSASPQTVELTMNSYRRDNNSPHIIQLWMDDNSQGAAKVVGEFVITEGLSDAKPYGIFTFRYAVYTDINPDLAVEDWQITDLVNANTKLDSNALPRLEFVYDSNEAGLSAGPPDFSLASITQLTNSNLDSGQSRNRFKSTYTVPGETSPTAYESEEAAIFDADVILTGYVFSNMTGLQEQRCYSRNTIYEDVWAYHLYYAEDDPAQGHSAGQRVVLDTNEQLEFTYTHTLANDRNIIVVDENPVTLYYGQESSLSGFPSLDWVSKYNLIDGTVLTSNEIVPVNYITKAVEVGEAPEMVDLSTCAGLDLAPVFNNVEIDPAGVTPISQPSVGLGDWPVVQ